MTRDRDIAEDIWKAPPSISRRAAVGLGLGCIAFGGALGFLGRGSAQAASREGSKKPAPKKDAIPEKLAWLRRVSEAPILELRDKAPIFVATCAGWPNDDATLKGLKRLGQSVIDDREAQQRTAIAALLCTHFARFAPTDPALLSQNIKLREIAGR